MNVSREDITLVLMPWLSHEFMESCPSRREHWVTCVTAASLIGGVFGGGVCERGGKKRERMYIWHGTRVDVGSSISNLFEVVSLV